MKKNGWAQKFAACMWIYTRCAYRGTRKPTPETQEYLKRSMFGSGTKKKRNKRDKKKKRNKRDKIKTDKRDKKMSPTWHAHTARVLVCVGALFFFSLRANRWVHPPGQVCLEKGGCSPTSPQSQTDTPRARRNPHSSAWAGGQKV